MVPDSFPAHLMAFGIAPDAAGRRNHFPNLTIARRYVMFLQGLGEMSGLAVSYFYKNTLGVSPATLSTITSLAAIPWTIKPLYGFLSDGWPIMG